MSEDMIGGFLESEKEKEGRLIKIRDSNKMKRLTKLKVKYKQPRSICSLLFPYLSLCQLIQINLCMCIENQTIGFIENSYKDILNVKRQFNIGKYRADLYFIDYKLVVECDEFNHADRDEIKEKIREEYILSLGNKIIRYNPNQKNFDLSNVLREINIILFSKSV